MLEGFFSTHASAGDLLTEVTRGRVFIWVVCEALDRPYSFLRSKLNKRQVARDISGTDRPKTYFSKRFKG